MFFPDCLTLLLITGVRFAPCDFVVMLTFLLSYVHVACIWKIIQHKGMKYLDCLKLFEVVADCKMHFLDFNAPKSSTTNQLIIWSGARIAQPADARTSYEQGCWFIEVVAVHSNFIWVAGMHVQVTPRFQSLYMKNYTFRTRNYKPDIETEFKFTQICILIAFPNVWSKFSFQIYWPR